MIPFDTFEKMPGGSPHRLLGSHPNGGYLAMQAAEYPAGQSAVWETETKRIVWKPEQAIALAWVSNGTQIGVLREALIARVPYEFALYTWPGIHLLHSCPIPLPRRAGWMHDLVLSPHDDLAVCHWIDQTEAGFECIDITAQGVSHDTQASYFLEGTNETTRAVFSPDGEFWVFGYKMYEVWWAPDPEDIDTYDQPARGGSYPLGALQVFHQKNRLFQQIL